MTLSQIVGARLSHLRKERNLSQDQMRKDLREYGVEWNRTAVSYIENGRRKVNVEELHGLSAYFDVAPWYFTTPLPDQTDKDVMLGTIHKPSLSLLTDLITRNDMTYNPKALAYKLADQSIRDGKPEIAKELAAILEEVGFNPLALLGTSAEG